MCIDHPDVLVLVMRKNLIEEKSRYPQSADRFEVSDLSAEFFLSCSVRHGKCFSASIGGEDEKL